MLLCGRSDWPRCWCRSSNATSRASRSRQRTAHLADYAGQISLPGGKIDASDESPAAAALREAEEEIALPRRFVAPIGYLDIHMTPFGHRIVPVLARVRSGFALRFNKGEVDDAFEVPLAFLMTPQNYKRETRNWNGLTLSLYAIPFGGRNIWGRPRQYFVTCTKECTEADGTNVAIGP